MTYQAPLEDINFLFSDLFNLFNTLEGVGEADFSLEMIPSILQASAKFAQEVLAPLNRVGDVQPPVVENGHVRTTKGFRQAFKQYADLGWQGLNHPTSIGGVGLPKVVGAAVNEIMHGANMSFALCPMLTDGVIELLTKVGTPKQQKKYIPKLINGQWAGTMNLTEPQAGSDLAQINTRAVKQDDGSYRIFGQKIFITYGEHDFTENIVHMVLARTPNAPAGVKGISLFIVPKYLANESGHLEKRNDVWCSAIESKLGIHASPTALMIYGDEQGDVGSGAIGYLVGKENEGLKYMFIMMNASRFAVGLQGVAISEAAYQAAWNYANERMQGRDLLNAEKQVVIAQHPDVQRMLKTIESLTQGMRALVYFAALVHDKEPFGEFVSMNSSQALYEFLVPVVKGFSTEMAQEVVSLAVQIYGGMGFIEETGVAQYFRDARILPIYEGTTGIQANDLLGRKLILDNGKIAKQLYGTMDKTLQAFHKASYGPLDEEITHLVVENFSQALTCYRKATNALIKLHESNRNAAYFGSVPYLMLVGTTVTGWLMMKAAVISAKKIDQQKNIRFYTKKLQSCVAFAALILPRTRMWLEHIQQGHLVFQKLNLEAS